MAVGLRTGLVGGIVTGSRVGSGVDEISPQSTSRFVTNDGASGRAVPLTTTEYTNRGYAAPTSIWGFQDASGNPADALAAAITLTASSPAGYQQAVPGWARRAITFNANSNDVLNNTSPNLPDTSTTSQLILAYIAVTATPGADAELILGGGQNTRIVINSSNVMKVSVDTGATITASGSTPVGTVVRPYVLKIDVTGSAIRGYNDLDKVAPAFNASPSGTKVFFAAGIENSPACAILYAAMWKGAAAEMSDATVKALLTDMGWTPPWA